MNIITTWMYSSPEGENILHSQVGSASGSHEVQEYYWRCVFLLFESSVRLNSAARHILFINKYPPDFIDGVNVKILVKQYQVEIVELETVTKSPFGYHNEWNSQFIMLDLLDWFRKNVTANDNVFILDSDIVFNKALDDNLLNMLNSHKALLYSINYDEQYSINGLSRRELLEISKEMNADFPGNEFIYSGGEFFCCKGSEIAKIADTARAGYHVSLERHQLGLKKFNEEAHLLSYVYHLFGYRAFTANRYIKRIWTDRSIFSNVDGSESDLIFWHLPAEKKAGFIDVFRSFREADGVYQLTAKNFAQVYRIEETVHAKAFRYIKKVLNPIHQIFHT